MSEYGQKYIKQALLFFYLNYLSRYFTEGFQRRVFFFIVLMPVIFVFFFFLSLFLDKSILIYNWLIYEIDHEGQLLKTRKPKNIAMLKFDESDVGNKIRAIIVLTTN